MCPSYLATNNETDVTRGRSRVLQEMASGNFSKSAKLAWDSDEVSESLDLCLSCKACASDCPAGVDMAKYKSEVLFRKYKGKIRPMSHYTLGKLPLWAKFGKKFPKIINVLTSSFLRPIRTILLDNIFLFPASAHAFTYPMITTSARFSSCGRHR